MPAITASPALSNLRILDLTRVRSGPTCVKQFADFGADVIKIEATTPEDFGAPPDSADYQNLHRNKRSLTLDLKKPEARDVFMRLVKTADVVVENFRPDVKARLGIDYESLRKVNKRIILASISGFGQDGPYRALPGLDQVAQGMSGIMSVTGVPGEGPMRVGAAVCDVTAGLLAALGIMTALLERERSGEGQWVQSSLLQAGLQLLDFQAARYTMSGEVPGQVGNDHPTRMPTSAYTTADGYLNVAATGDVFWRKLCEAIARPELIVDSDYATSEARSKNRKGLNAELNAIFKAKTTAEWIAILNDAQIPCGPIYTMDAVFADEQMQHLKVTSDVVHPRLGKETILSQMAILTRTPGAVKTASPERGAHTDEVLREAGYTDAEIAELHAKAIV
ncbi:MAG: CaiB/BaiF CoA-transferase family protein [Vulcanimicrobiaceae bacterium]|jgi:formyl-CoA transferase